MLSKIQLAREDFINQFPPLNLLNKKDLATIWENEGVHLYIHIPYCAKKCDFCYYVSTECRGDQVPDRYVDTLISEMELYNSLGYFHGRRIMSIYFGGGTPTMLSTNQIERICNAIHNNFEVSENCEFCCEVRPGPETTKEKILLLQRLGVNRFSMGCQSLNDNVLRINGRNHNAAYFYRTFQMLRECNVYSINVDIMSGMLGDCEESFMETVKALLKLEPENITIYKMEVYLNNNLYKKVINNEYKLMSNDEELKCVSKAYNEIIDQGYLFADNYTFVKSQKFVQKQRYDNWKGEDMIGLGLSSHSYYQNYLYQNESNLEEYYKKIEGGVLPIRRAYRMSVEEKMRRWIIFAIKKMDVSLNEFKKIFGIEVFNIFAQELQELVAEGFIVIEEKRLKTTMKGALFADDIVRILYPEKYKNIVLAHKKRN